MNLFERILALLLIIVVTTACGTAKFQGKGANKSKDVDDLSVEPVLCEGNTPCPNPCETALTTTPEENVSQSNSTLVPGQSSVSASCPVDEHEDDASQNSDHQS